MNIQSGVSGRPAEEGSVEAQGCSALTNGNELCDLIFDRAPPPVPREETTPFSQVGKAIWRLFSLSVRTDSVYRWLVHITCASANTQLMVVCRSGG